MILFTQTNVYCHFIGGITMSQNAEFTATTYLPPMVKIDVLTKNIW